MNARPTAPPPVSEQTEEILAERARRLLASVELAAEDDSVPLAELRFGAERFALLLSTLRACVPFRGVTPVPFARRGVLGVARYEGRIVPVYQLHALLGVRWSADPEALLFVEAAERVVAFEAEAVPTALAIPAAILREATGSAGDAVRSLPMPGAAPLRLVEPRLLISGARR